MGDVIDLAEHRSRVTSGSQAFVDMTEDEPTQWIVQLLQAKDDALPGEMALLFGVEGIPGFILTLEQARLLGEALVLAADHVAEALDKEGA